jgi:hypothetical protein
MTAESLLQLLEEMGIVLALDQDGNIDYLTADGPLPPKLRTLMRTHKPALASLLHARRPPMPETYQSPEASVYRRWVTGSTLGQFGTYRLEAPIYQTTRHEPVVYWGEACTYKACQKSVSTAGQSRRFFPSGLCVSCWERADKRVTTDVEKEDLG